MRIQTEQWSINTVSKACNQSGQRSVEMESQSCRVAVFSENFTGRDMKKNEVIKTWALGWNTWGTLAASEWAAGRWWSFGDRLDTKALGLLFDIWDSARFCNILHTCFLVFMSLTCIQNRSKQSTAQVKERVSWMQEVTSLLGAEIETRCLANVCMFHDVSRCFCVCLISLSFALFSVLDQSTSLITWIESRRVLELAVAVRLKRVESNGVW